MKLTITCQICGKILSAIDKPQISDDDIAMYKASSFCDTVQGSTVDEDGNDVTVYDGQTNIQTTKTVS